MEELENSKEETKIKLKKILKRSIVKDIITNFGYAVLVSIYFICFNTQIITLENTVLIQYIHISSIAFLVLSIIILEISFKKNNKKISLYGIEFLILAIFTLLIKHIPKIFEITIQKYTELGIYSFITYYMFKSIIMFTKEKQDELKSLSDIKEIVKEEPIKKATKRKNKKIEEGIEND